MTSPKSSHEPPRANSNPWMMVSFLLVGLIVGYGFNQLWNGHDGSMPRNEDSVQADVMGADEDEDKTPPTQQVEVQPKVYDVGVDDDAAMGDPDAPITVIEFSDFACYWCGVFHRDTLPLIKENYVDTGLVYFVYRDQPNYQNSTLAAESAECAGEQGAFWEMHDAIFDTTGTWSSAPTEEAMTHFSNLAGQVGINTTSFNSCLENHDMLEEVLADEQVANNNDAKATPTFFVNGTRVVGAQTYETFSGIFESLLEE